MTDVWRMPAIGRWEKTEQEEEFCKLSKARREEIEDPEKYNHLISHIEDLHKLPDLLKIHGDNSGDTQTPF